MDDLFQPPGLPGYRLHKVQVMNWGTFDSAKGQVHTVRPNGRTSLLIGQNGCGKSTLVDSILTLLVRPNVRNYNVAAGSTGRKRERDEKSYLLGAYGHASSEGENRASTLYLRKDGRHLSVLLAYFENTDLDRGFTIAQVLYATKDGKVEKIFCFAKGERDIAQDFGAINSVDRIVPQLESCGFKTTRTFAAYQKWLITETKMRSKAMDVFNQTVAVKDIRSLTEFIREHMLEGEDWEERIDNILNHFTQLSEAHRLLVDSRDQLEVLGPVAQAGIQYQTLRTDLEKREQIEQASDTYFRVKTMELFAKAREDRGTDVERLKRDLEAQTAQLEETEEQIRRLQNDMENAGGERLRSLPFLITQKQEDSKRRRERAEKFRQALSKAGAGPSHITDQESFQAIHTHLGQLRVQLDEELQHLEDLKLEAALQARECKRKRDELEVELGALSGSGSNLPEAYELLRLRLCEVLGLQEENLPYVAELLAVRGEDTQWQGAIEMVLRGLGLSMLIPSEAYRQASRFINRTRLHDQSGKGQRLVYHRIPESLVIDEAAAAGMPERSLFNKLDFREDHPLIDWVKNEVKQRYNFLCCDSVEEFQDQRSMALTLDRHVKLNRGRHEKDDRDHMANPRFYILGWNNEAKIQILRQEFERTVEDYQRALVIMEHHETQVVELRARQDGIRRALEVRVYAEIDHSGVDAEISELLREKESLEGSDEVVSTLAHQLAASRDLKQELKQKESVLIKKIGVLEREATQATEMLANAHRRIEHARYTGEFNKHQEHFAAIESDLRSGGILLRSETLFEDEAAYMSGLRSAIARIREKLEPLEKSLLQSMSRFLRRFRQFEHELRDDPQYLNDFIALHDRLEHEDLPRHEQSFKERLNEKVTTEIGILNNQLSNEREEIMARIEVLNRCLHTIDYDSIHGTFMQLEPKPVRDKEIDEFQRSLKDCLAGMFEGAFEADEARFKKIEELIVRLRDEPRWREKVTDVRRWFDFGARETVRSTGEERGYYSDSMGQSGGEKAKLAFTILVAAVVYQFDINPEEEASSKFHFVVVDEMFSKIDDAYAEYAMKLFQKFGLQLLIVAPFDAKAKVTEPFVDYYIHVVKKTNRSRALTMTAAEFKDRFDGNGGPVPLDEVELVG